MTTVSENSHAAIPLLLDILEAADLLRVSRSTIYALMRADDLASVKVGSRRLVTGASITTYIARQA